ncbi:MAG: SRPBCC family protein [Alphaproteobacteria bacterium]|nr:SRPBCC family protein [Alphaproteobacteria bacterium]
MPLGQNGMPRRSDGNGPLDALNRMPMDDTRLAKLLGWVSLALGLAGAMAPRSTARLIGVADDETNCRALQLVGVRELVSGVGVLSNPEAPGWLWSRVAGDAMDLALLGSAYASDEADTGRLSLATAAVIGITLADLLCAERLSAARERPPERGRDRHSGTSGALAQASGRARATIAEWTGNRPVHVISAITINAPAEELYRFWRNVENLPRAMRHIEAVQALDDRSSRWRAKGPLGSPIEWESEITQDMPNERIAWRSRPGAALDTRGAMTFKPASGGRGTVVKVVFDYRPPGGAVGAAFARLIGKAPDQEAEEDLRRLKQIFETGEILESDATAKGSGASQPPEQVPERTRGRTLHGADPVIESAEGSPV